MRLYRAEIFLGGSRNNSVIKENLPAAEVVILRHLHGVDSVLDIVHTGQKQIPYNALYAELVGRYGQAKVVEVFPGASPVLPESLADVGVFREGDNETVASGENNPNFKSVAAKAREAGGIDSDSAVAALG